MNSRIKGTRYSPVPPVLQGYTVCTAMKMSCTRLKDLPAVGP
ncbi:hypothetical protein EC12741_B0101 [Escherichia coli 1.2741]|nr:hypothetical protein EC12741_B0101 [Escherichia coli 1.2741]